MKIILGNICYPKSKALIIPANSKAIMSRGIPARIIKDGMKGILREAKQIVENEEIEVSDCFVTGPGRLKRRGVEKIYHVVIKKLQSDFTSLYTVQKSLQKTLQKVIDDQMSSVTVCGLGIESAELDKKSVARITVEICNRFKDNVNIKIIDDNDEFIKEAMKIACVNKNGGAR